MPPLDLHRRSLRASSNASSSTSSGRSIPVPRVAPCGPNSFGDENTFAPITASYSRPTMASQNKTPKPQTIGQVSVSASAPGYAPGNTKRLSALYSISGKPKSAVSIVQKTVKTYSDAYGASPSPVIATTPSQRILSTTGRLRLRQKTRTIPPALPSRDSKPSATPPRENSGDAGQTSSLADGDDYDNSAPPPTVPPKSKKRLSIMALPMSNSCLVTPVDAVDEKNPFDNMYELQGGSSPASSEHTKAAAKSPTGSNPFLTDSCYSSPSSRDGVAAMNYVVANLETITETPIQDCLKLPGESKPDLSSINEMGMHAQIAPKIAVNVMLKDDTGMLSKELPPWSVDAMSTVLSAGSSGDTTESRQISKAASKVSSVDPESADEETSAAPPIPKRSVRRQLGLNAAKVGGDSSLRSSPTVATSNATASAWTRGVVGPANRVSRGSELPAAQTEKHRDEVDGNVMKNRTLNNICEDSVSNDISSGYLGAPKRAAGGAEETDGGEDVVDSRDTLQPLVRIQRHNSNGTRASNLGTGTTRGSLKNKLSTRNIRSFFHIGHRVPGSSATITNSANSATSGDQPQQKGSSNPPKQNTHSHRLTAGLDTVGRSLVKSVSRLSLASVSKTTEKMDDMDTFEYNEIHFPRDDPRAVFEDPDLRYWTGRITTLRSNYMNDPEMKAALINLAVTTTGTGGNIDEKAENMQKRFGDTFDDIEFNAYLQSFEMLNGWCKTNAARRSLWEFQQIFARKNNEPGLLPFGGSMTDSEPTTLSRMTSFVANKFGSTLDLSYGKHRRDQRKENQPLRRTSIHTPNITISPNARAHTPSPTVKKVLGPKVEHDLKLVTPKHDKGKMVVTPRPDKGKNVMGPRAEKDRKVLSSRSDKAKKSDAQKAAETAVMRSGGLMKTPVIKNSPSVSSLRKHLNKTPIVKNSPSILSLRKENKTPSMETSPSKAHLRTPGFKNSPSMGKFKDSRDLFGLRRP